MRTGTILVVAGVCGVAAFGATLVVRAPRVPPPRRDPVASGRTMLASGIPPHDLSSLRAIVQVEPKDFWALYLLALRESWAGNAAASEQCWIRAEQAALEVNPGDALGPRAAMVLGECGRHTAKAGNGADWFRQALAGFRRRMDERPGTFRAPLYAAWCSHRLGLETDAAEYWGKVEEIIGAGGQGTDPERLFTLACVRSQRRYDGLAIDALEALAKTGWSDRELLEHAEEFEGIRDSQRFRQLLESMRTPAQGADGGAGGTGGG